ncbi:MAG: histidinol-phosphatase HisJ family protein [Sumerlaeia bacterium]
MIDLHNHTPACHHAVGEPEEYVRRAIEQGVQEYGISEHSPWILTYPNEPLSPTEPEFRQLLKRLEGIRDSTTELKFRIGIEADYIPEKCDEALAFFKSYPFDYIIGSVHNIGQWIFDDPGKIDQWDERDVDVVYSEYLALMQGLIEWGQVDILAHLDLPKKFGHKPTRGLLPVFESLIPMIAEAGVVVEVNCAGRIKPVGEFYPHPDIVRALVKAGVPMTVSSDGHSPAQVGHYRQEAIQMLRDFGAKEIFSFSQRQKIGYRI